MNSRSLVIGSIAVGIAIGYIASFLTFCAAAVGYEFYRKRHIKKESQGVSGE